MLLHSLGAESAAIRRFAAAGALCAAPAHAVEVHVEDASGCVDRSAVVEALERVEGTRGLEVRVLVLPEGTARVVTLEWVGLDQRELDVSVGDCPRLPVTLALATERMLARLPSDLRPTPARWEHGIGLDLGPGLWPASPWVGLWTEHATLGDLGLVVGPVVGLTSQPVGSGRVHSLSVGSRFGLRGRVGRSRLDAGVVGQLVLGQSVGLLRQRMVAGPRVSGRAAWSTGDRVRVGVALEGAFVYAGWEAGGVPGEPHHPIALALFELGWRLGES